MRIETLRIEHLSPHPILDRVSLVSDAALALADNHHGDPARKERAVEMTEDWLAWVEEIRAHGVLEPLKVVVSDLLIHKTARDRDGITRCLVIDGRHRLQGATDAGLTHVPCEIVDESQIHAHMESSVIARRHWTKSMLAYFAVLLHPEVANEGRRGNPDFKAKSNSAQNAELGGSAQNANPPLTREQLAERYRVAPRLLDDAIWIYRKLEASPRLRPRTEPSLWAGVPLMRLRLGIEGAESTLDKPRPAAAPGSTTWGKYVNGLGKRLAEWDAWSEEQRIQFQDDFRELAAECPPEARAALREAVLGADPDPATIFPTPHGAQGEPATTRSDEVHETGGGDLLLTPPDSPSPPMRDALATSSPGYIPPGSLACQKCGRHGFSNQAALNRHQILCRA